MTAPHTVGLAYVADEYRQAHGVTLATLARRAGMMPTALRLLLDREVSSTDAGVLEALARALGISPNRLREYRMAIVVGSLAQNLARMNALFLECLSPIERELIGSAEFNDQAFGATVWRLLAENELTQQELAESIGFAPATLSRVMNGHDRLSVELLETIAHALDTAPEMFIEYRLELVEEWLREHPERTDELFDDLTLATTVGVAGPHPDCGSSTSTRLA